MTSSQFLFFVLVFQVLMYCIAVVFREDKIASTAAVIGIAFFIFYPFIIYGILKGY